MLLAWIIAGGLVVLGLGAVVVGWRGRRVNEHPICRKCGFDLVGLSAPEKCPECGRSVTGPRAVRVGARSRRVGLIAVGGAMLVIGVLGGGGLGWGAAKGVNWQSQKSDWLLMQEADGWFGSGNEGVLKELLRRGSTATLSDEHLRELSQRALRIQSKRDRLWNDAWGDLFVLAYKSGLVSERERNQFLQGICNPQLLVRPRVRAGVRTVERLIVGDGLTGNRGPSANQFASGSRDIRIELLKDGNVISTTRPLSRNGEMRRSGMSVESEQGFVAGAAPGHYRLRSVYSWQVSLHPQGVGDSGWPVEITDERDFEITAPDEPTVALVTDQAIARDAAASFSITVSQRLSPSTNEETYWMDLRRSESKTKAVPILAFAVAIRERDGPHTGRVRRSTGTLTIRHNFRFVTGAIEGAPATNCSAIDVALFPSLEAGEAEPDIDQIWDGAIVFDNVPVADTRDFKPTILARVLSPAPKVVEAMFKKE